MATTTTAISAEGRVRRMRLIDVDRLIELMNERDAVCSEPKNAVDIGYSLAVKHMKYEIEQNNEYHCKIYDVDIKQCECKKPKTNADRIRSMSDEELAEFLADSEKFSPCNNCDFHFADAMNDDCKAPDGWICTKGYAAALIQKWLQS